MLWEKLWENLSNSLVETRSFESLAVLVWQEDQGISLGQAAAEREASPFLPPQIPSLPETQFSLSCGGRVPCCWLTAKLIQTFLCSHLSSTSYYSVTSHLFSTPVSSTTTWHLGSTQLMAARIILVKRGVPWPHSHTPWLRVP